MRQRRDREKRAGKEGNGDETKTKSAARKDGDETKTKKEGDKDEEGKPNTDKAQAACRIRISMVRQDHPTHLALHLLGDICVLCIRTHQ